MESIIDKVREFRDTADVENVERIDGIVKMNYVRIECDIPLSDLEIEDKLERVTGAIVRDAECSSIALMKK